MTHLVFSIDRGLSDAAYQMQLHDHAIRSVYATQYFPLIPNGSRIADSPQSRRPQIELLHRCDSQPPSSSARRRRVYIGMFMPPLMTRPPYMYLLALKYPS